MQPPPAATRRHHSAAAVRTWCSYVVVLVLVSKIAAWQQQQQQLLQSYQLPDQGYWTSPYSPRTQPAWPYYPPAPSWGSAAPAGYVGSHPGWSPPPPTYPNQLPASPPYQQPPAPVLPPDQQPVLSNQQQVTSHHRAVVPTNQQEVVHKPVSTNHQLHHEHHLVPGSQQAPALPTYQQMNQINHVAYTQQHQHQPAVPAPHHQFQPAQPPVAVHPAYQQMSAYHQHQEAVHHQGWDPSAQSAARPYVWSDDSPDASGWEQPPPPPPAHRAPHQHQHHGWDQPMLWNQPSSPHEQHLHDDLHPSRPTRSSAPPSWVQDPNQARPIGYVVLDGRIRVPVRDYRLVLEHYLRAGWRDVVAEDGARLSAGPDYSAFERAVRQHPAALVSVSAHATVPADTYCRVVRTARDPGRADAVLEFPDGTTCPLHQLAGRADLAAWLHALFPQGLVPGRHHGTPHVWAPAAPTTTTTPSPPPPSPVHQGNTTDRPAEDTRTLSSSHKQSAAGDAGATRPTAAPDHVSARNASRVAPQKHPNASWSPHQAHQGQHAHHAHQAHQAQQAQQAHQAHHPPGWSPQHIPGFVQNQGHAAAVHGAPR